MSSEHYFDGNNQEQDIVGGHVVVHMHREVDEYGEEFIDYMLVHGEVDQKWAAYHYPSRHCQHEHDCCGNWYPAEGRVVGNHSMRTVVAQSFGLNI